MTYEVIIRWKEDKKIEKVKFADEDAEDNDGIFFVGNPYCISKKEDFDVLAIAEELDNKSVNVTLLECQGCRDRFVEDMVDNGEFIGYLDSLNLVDLFNDYGFKVTNEMIYHNTTAWVGDYKSGYRGVSCHLFTPCGCNILSFLANKLSKANKSWQVTYGLELY